MDAYEVANAIQDLISEMINESRGEDSHVTYAKLNLNEVLKKALKKGN